MMIRHHLNDATLLAYVAGGLPEAFSLVAAAHVSLCDDCRARLMALETLGGAMIETTAAQMSAASMDAALERIFAAPLPPRPALRDRPVPRPVFPAPLRDCVGGDLDAVKWRALGGGAKQAILPTRPDATVRLLDIPAGRAMPDHRHAGTGMTMVLKGAFRDAETRFGPGDVQMADASIEHGPVAEDRGDCICLAATEAKLRFKALLPRLAQPFIRI
jgi:putative transcriptional regulator